MNKSHYYGDTVRKLFLTSAVLMIITLPFMARFIEVPLYISILAALAISVFAGITNPLQRWVAVLNFLIALAGAFIFENAAINGYSTYSIIHQAFYINQILAILFIVTLYFTTKTLRGMLLK